MKIAKIEMRPIEAIKPNPKNPRKKDPAKMKELADSIARNPDFFAARPILLSDRTGELIIIGGERRWEAAKMKRMTEVPTLLMTGLTEEQEDEIMVRDNTHNGIWDEGKLAQWSKEQLEKWNCPVTWEDAVGIPGAENLPEEIRDIAIAPAPLPKIKGENRVAMERIIIVYPKDKEAEIADLLGLEQITKVVYTADEIL